MTALDARPWLSRYPEGISPEVDVPDEPVWNALERAADRWPERVAVDFFGAATTYAELTARTQAAAAALEGLGVRPGARVAIVAPNCTAHVVAFNAVLRLGAVVVECNPTYTASELAHQFADAGVELAIVWTKTLPAALDARERLGEQRVRLLSLDMTKDLPRGKQLALRLPVAKARELRTAMLGPVPHGLTDWHDLERRHRGELPSASTPAASDIALLQYTGGTTGTPKGAVLSHGNLVANAVQGQAWARFAEGEETVYGALPFFHAFGMVFCLTLSVRIGATVVAFPKF